MSLIKDHSVYFRKEGNYMYILETRSFVNNLLDMRLTQKRFDEEDIYSQEITGNSTELRKDINKEQWKNITLFVNRHGYPNYPQLFRIIEQKVPMHIRLLKLLRIKRLIDEKRGIKHSTNLEKSSKKLN